MKRPYVNAAVIFLTVALLVPIINGCSALPQVMKSNRADIKVCSISPRTAEGYVGMTSNGRVALYVQVKPLNIQPDKFYYLVLISRTGYLYDLCPESWSSKDLAGPSTNERDIGKINEAINKSIRTELFSVSAFDKDIDPLRRDFNNFYSERRTEASKNGELSLSFSGWSLGKYEPDENDINNICTKYVEAKLVTEEEVKTIKGAGAYFGFTEN